MDNKLRTIEHRLMSEITYDVVAEHMKARDFDPDNCQLSNVIGSIRKLIRKPFFDARAQMRGGGWIIVDGPVTEPSVCYAIDAGSRTTLDRDIGFVQELHSEFRFELLQNGIYSGKLDLDWTVDVYGKDSPVIVFQCEIHHDEREKLVAYLSDACETTHKERGFRRLESATGWVIDDWMWRTEDFDDE